MTITFGILESFIAIVFVVFCVVMNYRAGRQAGIDQMIDHMKLIGTLKIVKENGRKTYLFATHELTEENINANPNGY